MRSRGSKLGIVGALVVGFTSLGNSTLAQIKPDSTLGSENSIVKPLNPSIDEIDGGAIRGANLFHSFSDFNVGEGRGVYFTNPVGIDNILSRVTGNNPSNILGRLGVLGEANLFLLNPNGIIFGPSSSLDIQGSFFATTADRIQFDENTYFSAKQPQQSSLLSVNPGALFFNQAANQPGNIINRGNLSVGKNLALKADNLDLQGQLLAGGDLHLSALNTLRIRDSVENPFIASAKGQLSIQGNQGVDIFVLNHPKSGLFSGGDMVLRSANQVGGDAHYWSGGNFRIEQLNGNLGDLYSPHDPVIVAAGDLFFNSYIGDSLHILAGGSVVIPGTVVIFDADTPSTSIVENVTLSDGTMLPINGSAQPTLDIRAGVDPSVVNSPNGIVSIGSGQFFTGRYSTTPSSADIIIGNVIIEPPNGLVFLTNQYQPNPSLAPGDILITGRGVSRQGAEFSRLGIDARGFEGNGSSVVLDSRDNIFLADDAAIDSSSAQIGRGGDIRLIANENISLGDLSFLSTFSGQNSDINSDINLIARNILIGSFASINASGGGDIRIQGERLVMQSYSNISSFVTGTEDGGNISIQAADEIRLDGGNIGTFVDAQASGKGGNITIETGKLTLISTELDVGRDIPLTGGDIGTDTFGEGDAGNVTINTRHLKLIDGAQIRASTGRFENTGGAGDAGDITIRASDFVEVTGKSSLGNQPSKIASQVTPGATGNGGDLLVETNRFVVSDGAQIQAGTAGQGKGGTLTVDAAEAVDIVDPNVDKNETGLFTGPLATASGDGGNLAVRTGRLNIIGAEAAVSTQVDEQATGNGGNVLIEANHISVGGGAQVSANTIGKGSGGTLTINAQESVELFGTDGEIPSGLVVGTFGFGDAGDLILKTNRLSIRDGATISASTLGLGDGKGGNLNVDASESVEVVGQSTEGKQLSSSIAAEAGNLLGFLINRPNITSTTDKGKAGSIGIITPRLIVRDGSEISASTSVRGNAGSITVKANSLEATNGGKLLTATQASGRAGDINLEISDRITLRGTASGIFANTTPDSTGDGGSIFIDPIEVHITDGAGIAVDSQGQGNGGSLTLQADTLNLDGGFLSAATASGTGGNVTLQIADSLQLRRNSEISAQATGTAEGGNIEIDTNFLLAFLSENNDIIANAAEGQGGRIQINAQGVFGTQFREQLNPSLSDINASSEIGLDGVVEINTPDVDLQNSLTQLAANFASPDQVVAGSCIARRNVERGSFTVTGTGGLPRNPYEAISSRYAVTNVQPLPGSSNISSHVAQVEPPTTWKLGDAIQEAQGMTVTADGRTIVGTNPQLVAVARAQDMICQSN